MKKADQNLGKDITQVWCLQIRIVFFEKNKKTTPKKEWFLQE
ncbi:hypothetical protein NU08_1855 [Flavobacterium anhuiense]|uniref:Uncharacterized protein n=1 Tax=Flavobacterium anhuiense TaxID=459526 RepID=A0A444VZJ2_9FLAO|nr:hypothetical protein NU08_1855 [Flavobacterium anhuiense]